MVGVVSHLSLVVTDKSRSLAFFTEKVGFEKKTDVTGPNGYRYVTVGAKGQDLELALWEVGSLSDPAQAEAAKRWTPAGSPPMILRVTDCKQAFKELSARGVEFPQPPTDHPWGTVATFKDPDGNLFSISQLKAWG